MANSEKDKRRFGLQTFFMNVQNNHFERVADKLIIKLQGELCKINDHIENDIKASGYMKHMEAHFLKKELYAISEMKIVYAYKHFETHLTFLLNASYPHEGKGNNRKKFYRWESVEDFLESKSIDIKKVSCYGEIDQLRRLNNTIKHNLDILSDKNLKIPEFSNKKEINYQDLQSFYDRVKDSGQNFLQSVSEKIEAELFDFDENRLEIISNKILSRMDEKAIKILIDKLSSQSGK